MNDQVGGCEPAASVLGVSSTSCSECPFPFCVLEETGFLRLELKGHLARTIRRLGITIEETAKAMGVSLRSICRYTNVYEDMGCAQCNLAHSQNVMCRSDTYSVVRKDGQFIIILNKHRHATIEELKIVEYLIDYAFPSSTVEMSTNGHDYWVLGRVELEEALNFEHMCDALDNYTLSLSGGTACR